jgi:phage minor tail protein G
MFLEKTVLQFGHEQTELSELTALQRAEYFERIAQLLADGNENVTDAGKGAALVRLNTELNAWLVSRSLWNCNREADLGEFYQQILSDWPEKALTLAAQTVITLSDLGVDDKVNGQEENVSGGETGVKPVEEN